MFCIASPGQPSCKDLYWNMRRPSERSGRASIDARARAAERRALMGVLSRELCRQIGGNLGHEGMLRTSVATEKLSLDVGALADVVLQWSTTPARRRAAPTRGDAS